MGTDLKDAWRGVVRGRWTSLTTVAALALGVAACVTAAAVAYAGLLRPLPFEAGDQLVSLHRVYQPTEMPSSVLLGDVEGWRTNLQGSMAVTAFATSQATIRTARGVEEVQAAYVDGRFLQVVGVDPMAGRLLEADTPGVALVTAGLARRLTGSVAESIGTTIVVSARSVTIVGVVPDSLAVLDAADVWLPAGSGQGGDLGYFLIARVHDDVSLDRARADVARAQSVLAPAGQKPGIWRTDVLPLRERLLGQTRPVLLVFLAASVLVMGVACANAALLLVNRAVARTREMAVRLALGASPWQLRRITVCEALLFSTAAVALGTVGAVTTIRTLHAETGLAIPRLATHIPIGLVASAALALWLVMVAVCATSPMLVGRFGNVTSSLRAGPGGSRMNRRTRSALVVAQLAMCAVLLVGAGLLGRTLWQVSAADLGIDRADQVLSVAVPLNLSLNTDRVVQLSNIRLMVEQAEQLPGVVVAGFGSNLPPMTGALAFTVRYVSDDRDASRTFDLIPVTAGYLEALGARVVEGRVFDRVELLANTHVAVVSESALRHLSPENTQRVGGDLNLRVAAPDGTRTRPQLIGVVRDIRYTGLDSEARGAIYVPWGGLAMRSGFLVARTTGDPSVVAAAVAGIVRSVDASMPPGQIRTLDEEVAHTLAPRTARFSLVGVFAAAAVALALVGLFSALIRSVVERQRELAIRAAIGASPARLLRSVLVHGVGLATLGIIAGLGTAATAGEAIAGLLHNVAARDPFTFVFTGVALFLLAVVASWLPARRAAASDPVMLLRSE